MSLMDDEILGLTVDEDDDVGITQERINDLALYTHDQNVFLEGLGRRVTPSFVRHYMEIVEVEDDFFWEKALRRLVKKYALHNLKMYLTDVKIANFNIHTMALIRDMKIGIPEAIIMREITKDMTREELEVYLKSKKRNFGTFLRWCIIFIGRDSYKSFMDRIFQERFDEFYEGVTEDD